MKSIQIKKGKIIIQNLAIIMIILSGAAHLALSLPHRINFLYPLETYYGRMTGRGFFVHKSLSVIIGVILILLCYRLYKRVRMAWIITLAALFCSAFSYTVQFRRVLNPMTLCEVFIIAVLLLSHRDFVRKPDRTTLKVSLLLAAASLLIMLTYASLGFFLLKSNYRNLDDIWHSIVMSVQLFILMDPSAASATTHFGAAFARYIVALNWVVLLAALFLVLKPIVYNPIASELDRKKVKELVRKYGQNPISYLAMEKDKKYFFGVVTEGVASYTVTAETAVCCGDIICNPEEASLFLAEFMIFCKQNGLSIVLLNVTDRLLPVYKAADFECAKYGEDALFKLDEYSLAGGKVASVRAAINHAVKAGITVSEYKPSEGRNAAVESEIKAISDSWLKSKACSELSFMFGSMGLEDPEGRRYFTAHSSDGQMLGFVVFNPYDNGNGYLAEITRRLPGAPQGVMEKIIYDAFMKMKEEGVEWGSLGLVPLANVREKDKNLFTERLFEFVYENLNKIYGFKALYHAKKKYAPTHWQPRYLVYYPPVFNAKTAYSVVKAQNPKGLSDYILALLKRPENKGKE